MLPTASNSLAREGAADRDMLNGKETESGSTPPNGSTPRKLKVLVVDDNADAGESLAMLLRIWGHETRISYDGPSALKVAEGFQPDVAFLDIGLPGMPGYDVARELRRTQTAKKLVLIALTGYGQDEDRRKTREAGFDEHLLKPAEPLAVKALLAHLQEML